MNLKDRVLYIPETYLNGKKYIQHSIQYDYVEETINDFNYFCKYKDIRTGLDIEITNKIWEIMQNII